jgi:predicted transcriptional regulator
MSFQSSSSGISKTVNEDLELLKNIGLVSITKAREGRERVVPRVNYDKIQLETRV